MIEMAPDAQGSPHRAVEAAHSRRTDAREIARQRAAEAAKTQSDWWGRCRRCGEVLEGTLKELKEHACGPAS